MMPQSTSMTTRLRKMTFRSAAMMLRFTAIKAVFAATVPFLSILNVLSIPSQANNSIFESRIFYSKPQIRNLKSATRN